MGVLLSTPACAEQKQILGGTKDTKPPTTEPIFFDEMKVESATWSEESLCRTIQRFFGLLPDSPGEVLKKEQQYPLFKQRSTISVSNVGNRLDAVVIVQRLYRRYWRLRTWHEVGNRMVQLARGRLAERRAQEQETISVAGFRLLLLNGVSASKVCISGALKTIQLRLVLDEEAGECYLTWTPSRKKKPRMNLHDIEQVVAVRQEGNPEAPRLSKKVSYRRGLILVCKSYSRGRFVLEFSSKQERNTLLCGFQNLLSEMISTGPALDNVGILRSQYPRRESAIDFFRARDEPQTSSALPADDFGGSHPNVVVPSSSSTRDSVTISCPQALAAAALDKAPVQQSLSTPKSLRSDAKVIEHFYQTRFDDDPPENT